MAERPSEAQLHQYAELSHLSFEEKERVYLSWLLQAAMSPKTQLHVPDAIMEVISEDPSLLCPALHGILRENSSDPLDWMSTLSIGEKSRMYLAWMLQDVLSPRTQRQVPREVTLVLIRRLDDIWPFTAYGLSVESLA